MIKNCERCNAEFTDYFRGRLCGDCKLLPPKSQKERKYETFYMETAFKDFLEAHDLLIWYPRPGRVMAGAGNYGWICGLDDYDGPKDPVGVGFFRPKMGASVTIRFNKGTRNLRFASRCWATTHRRKIAYKKWQNWMASEDSCPCLGCHASRTLTKLAKKYYGDHINNDGVRDDEGSSITKAS